MGILTWPNAAHQNGGNSGPGGNRTTAYWQVLHGLGKWIKQSSLPPRQTNTDLFDETAADIPKVTHCTTLLTARCYTVWANGSLLYSVCKDAAKKSAYGTSLA